MLGLPGEQLVDDRRQSPLTRPGECFARRIRPDRALESARVVFQTPVGTMTADHLVEHHAQRPQIHVLVDVAGLEPFGRRIGSRPPVVGRHQRGPGERLRDAEIEHLDSIGPGDQDVIRLEVCVNDPMIGLIVDDGFEPMGLVEELANRLRILHGESIGQRTSCDDGGQLLRLDVLHHDAEERFEISPFVDGRHIVVNPPELLLEHGAATLGLDLLAALGRGNQLDGHRPAARRKPPRTRCRTARWRSRAEDRIRRSANLALAWPRSPFAKGPERNKDDRPGRRGARIARREGPNAQSTAPQPRRSCRRGAGPARRSRRHG